MKNKHNVFCILSDERAFKSKSPVMHTAVLKALGIKGEYVPFMVKAGHIWDAVKGIRALNIAGANITVPYKEAVMPFLDELSEEARVIGAVNTIVREGSRLKGYNTDAAGFIEALESTGFKASGKSAIVFGTGGAAKAILFALKKMNMTQVILAGRNKEKTEKMASAMNAIPCLIDSLASQKPLTAHLAVNASSVSATEESPELAELISKLNLPNCEFVMDINYGRAHNFWEELAKAHDAEFMHGLPMLAYQARRSFALWTNIEVEAEKFLNALELA